MELNAKTKINDLLKQYPFLEDYLITLSSRFKGLKNPIMRKTMGKVATLEMAASVSGLDLDKLISSLTAEIDKQSSREATSGEAAAASRMDPLTDPKQRQAALKGIIKDLHDGEDMAVLKQRFRDLIQGVAAPEIAKMEQELMNEGLPAEEIKRLCDVHVEIFKEALFFPVLLCASSIVHNIPETEYSLGMFMAAIKPLQSGDNFPLETQRCFIHYKQSWLKGLGRTGNYSLTNLKDVPGVDFNR